MKNYRRNFRMYVEEVSNDGSEFELRFEIDGEVVDKITGNCMEDILIYSYDFFRKNCEENNFDSRFDRLRVSLNFEMGM